MTNGLGAAFFGITLLAVLLGIAGLLVGVTALAVYWRRGGVPTAVEYVAVGLVGVAVLVAGFGIVALVDEATPLAALFAAIVALPLLAVAGRARWRGAEWVTVAAVAGMAWCLPFIAGVVLLLVVQANSDVSVTIVTALAGIATTGGALVSGEYVSGVLSADGSTRVRRG